VEEKKVVDKKKRVYRKLSLDFYLLFHEVSKQMGLLDCCSVASSGWDMEITKQGT
jgi:hypothetical protein